MKSKSLLPFRVSPGSSFIAVNPAFASSRRLAALCLMLLCATAIRGRATDITWTNASGGNWNTAANWDPNQVPGASDAAIITNDGSYTVTLDVNATVVTLILGGASGTQIFDATSRTLTLDGASVINANGVMALISSTLAGAGTLTNQGTLNPVASTINVALVNQGMLLCRRVNIFNG